MKQNRILSTVSKLGLVLALVTAVFMGFVGVAVSQGTSSPTVTASATVLTPVCLLGVNSDTLNFGTLYSGATIAPSASTGITVTNDSTTGISTGLTVSGSAWSDSGFADFFGATNTTVVLATGPANVIYTSTSDTDNYTAPFALATTPSGLVTNLGPSPATAGLFFGLTVPVGQAADSYTQTITVASTC
jgi:hypothetical protein